MKRVFTATVFLTLLSFALPPRVAFGVGVPNTTACRLPELRAKHGSYENCVNKTERVMKITPGFFAAYDRAAKYIGIRNSFSKLPSKDFVLSADSCEKEKELRRTLEEYVSKLRDLRDEMGVLQDISNIAQAEKDIETIVEGKLSTEQSWKSSEIHESIAKLGEFARGMDALIGEIQMTQIEDQCSKPKDSDKPTWTAGDTETTKDDIPIGAIGPWVWPSGEPETVELTPPGGDAGPGGCGDERREVKRVALRYSIGGTEGDAPAGGSCGACKEGFESVPGAGGQIQCLTGGEIEEAAQCEDATASYNPETHEVRCVAVSQGGSPAESLIGGAISTGIGIAIGSAISRSRRRRPRHPQPSGPRGGGGHPPRGGGGCPGC